ncbi:MAG: spore germination protein [Firmicutes bacterium HGW-Firmicutes-14]|nr:MAG: spore germination protein [Firmicutes bacterium HGW-Firmicutes-14]
MRIWKKAFGWIKPQEKLIFEDKNTDISSDKQPLSANLEINLALLGKLMGEAQDLIIREFSLGHDEHRAAVVLIDGLAEKELVNEQILNPLMLEIRFEIPRGSNELFNRIKKYGIPNTAIKEDYTIDGVINDILTGNTVLLLEGVDRALMISSQGWKDRSISEPITESVVRGPRDGFTETLRTNTTLIRRRIKSPDLRLEGIKIGTRTQTDVVIAYLNGVAKKDVVDEVRTRLESIKIDGVLESGYIEEFIEDRPLSPFPQVERSERPDKVASALLEGRVAILVDTTPFVLMVPTVFFQFIQASEDYYERYYIGSMIRVLRVLALMVSITLPAIYIALTSFHHEMIPTPLALSIASSREAVPFPAVGEALIMGIFFEILREAGIRLPRPTGQAVSIVGALVIGQAAVEAGIVSQAMVIVVALTGISSFAIPAYNAAVAGILLRVPLVILAGFFGLFGILTGLSLILIHLCGLKVFGINYLSIVTSAGEGEYKDFVVRAPWWSMFHRAGRITGKSKKKT